MFNRQLLIKYISRQAIRALVIVMVAIIVIYFLKGQISAKQVKIAESRTASLTYSKQQDAAKSLAASLEKYQPLVNQLKTALVPAAQTDALVKQLEEMAKASNLKFALKISLADEKSKDKQSSTKIIKPGPQAGSLKISLNGSISNIIKYLNQLKNLDILTNLKLIRLSGSPEDWPNGINADIEGLIYLLVEGE